MGIFFIVVIVFAIIALMRAGRGGKGYSGYSGSTGGKGIDILEERFARGEITAEQFRTMKVELLSSKK